jgi:hypothetical protein
MEAAAIADAKRDRTFEEFEEQYADHIAGKIDPALRVGNRPVTAGFDGADGDGSIGHVQPKPSEQ